MGGFKWFKRVCFLSVLTGILLVAAAQAQENSRQVLMLGDSLTAGLGVMPEQAYPALVQKKLAQKIQADTPAGVVTVVNAGISGSTSASAVSRIKWYLKMKPDILVLALGANDGLRGLSVDEMKINLDTAISLAREAGIQVILAGMRMPPNYGEAYTKAFEQVFFDLAERHQIPLIPFLLAGVAGHADLNQADGIHPNAKGHAIIAQTVFPYILEAL